MNTNVINNFKQNITKELSGQPDLRRDTLKNFEGLKENNKGSQDFLKNVDSISEIRKLISNKKLSNNQIKKKIKEFLNDPEELKDFLTSLLDETKPKKTENKEATATGGGSGSFITALEGSVNTPKNDVPTVREEVLRGGKADNITLLDLAKKHAYDDSKDSTSKEKISKMYTVLKTQLEKGIKVEMEHTKDKSKAKEIVMDHLSEDPKYYDKLKKVEAKEATGAGSAGAYSQPAIWAKSMKKKDFRGYAKPLYKGGKFVQVKKKCKKFPYCNQGDIKALKIFENETVQNAIDSVSSRFGINKEFISDIVFEQIRKTQK